MLAPSVVLRNKYDTYGIDMNNSSVVLRFEHHGTEVMEMRSQEYEGDMSLEAVQIKMGVRKIQKWPLQAAL